LSSGQELVGELKNAALTATAIRYQQSFSTAERQRHSYYCLCTLKKTNGILDQYFLKFYTGFDLFC